MECLSGHLRFRHRHVPEPEAKLLQLINQARENPLTVAASLGMDPEQILADFPEWHDLLTQGLPPLTFSMQSL